MKRHLPFIALTLFAANAVASDPPSARALLSTAQEAAKKDGKNVMVIFHASWCGWCKKLDTFLADKEMKPLIESNFVVVHLDVLENGDKEALENEGGETVMKQLGGEKAGLPFTAIISPTGKLVVNSNEKEKGTAGNIGYPAAENEIAHFIAMLKAGAPKMTATQRSSIQTWLTKNSPAR